MTNEPISTNTKPIKNQINKTWVYAVFVLLVGFLLGFAVKSFTIKNDDQRSQIAVSNQKKDVEHIETFKSCVEANGEVANSVPKVCVFEGVMFVEEVENYSELEPVVTTSEEEKIDVQEEAISENNLGLTFKKAYYSDPEVNNPGTVDWMIVEMTAVNSSEADLYLREDDFQIFAKLNSDKTEYTEDISLWIYNSILPVNKTYKVAANTSLDFEVRVWTDDFMGFFPLGLDEAEIVYRDSSVGVVIDI